MDQFIYFVVGNICQRIYYVTLKWTCISKSDCVEKKLLDIIFTPSKILANVHVDEGEVPHEDCPFAVSYCFLSYEIKDSAGEPM